MIKRIIEISQSRTYLSVRNSQLIIETHESGKEGKNQIPCEDIGLLIIDHPATCYTHTVFTELIQQGAAVLICGADHHPAGMFLPVAGNTLQSERTRHQLDAKLPIKKQLWKQIIQAKIKHQAAVLGKDSPVADQLIDLSKKVRSGDPDNIEAWASRKYWPEYLTGFRRFREGLPPNNLLNYGYAVLRAAVARALCGAGLILSMGIHHRNKYNSFCLADDLIEPFRGYIDQQVKNITEELCDQDEMKLDQSTKAALLSVLYQTIEMDKTKGPLMVSLHKTAASLARCFAGEENQLLLPTLFI